MASYKQLLLQWIFKVLANPNWSHLSTIQMGYLLQLIHNIGAFGDPNMASRF